MLDPGSSDDGAGVLVPHHCHLGIVQGCLDDIKDSFLLLLPPSVARHAINREYRLYLLVEEETVVELLD